MPRIAAALGLVATVAFCIGFNVKRYPLVWEMTMPGHSAGALATEVAQTTSASKQTKSAATEGKPAKSDSTPAEESPAVNISAKEDPESSVQKTGTAEQSTRYESLHPIPIAEPSEVTPGAAPKASPPAAAWERSAPQHDPLADREPVTALPEGKYAAAAGESDAKPAPATSSADKPAKRKAEVDKTAKKPDKKAHPADAKHNRPGDADKAKQAAAKRAAPGNNKKDLANTKEQGPRDKGTKEQSEKLAQRPMVPFSATPADGAATFSPHADPSEPSAEFRRLPAVDPYQPAPENPYAAASTPVYPNTGIQ
jgi:hypothetical protein